VPSIAPLLPPSPASPYLPPASLDHTSATGIAVPLIAAAAIAGTLGLLFALVVWRRARRPRRGRKVSLLAVSGASHVSRLAPPRPELDPRSKAPDQPGHTALLLMERRRLSRECASGESSSDMQRERRSPLGRIFGRLLGGNATAPTSPRREPRFHLGPSKANFAATMQRLGDLDTTPKGTTLTITRGRVSSALYGDDARSRAVMSSQI